MAGCDAAAGGGEDCEEQTARVFPTNGVFNGASDPTVGCFCFPMTECESVYVVI